MPMLGFLTPINVGHFNPICKWSSDGRQSPTDWPTFLSGVLAKRATASR
jgi:hypothetical protein